MIYVITRFVSCVTLFPIFQDHGSFVMTVDIKWVVLNAFAKSFGPCQPAQSAQTDMGRNFLLYVNFSACQRTALHHNQVFFFYKTNSRDRKLGDVVL